MQCQACRTAARVGRKAARKRRKGALEQAKRDRRKQAPGLLREQDDGRLCSSSMAGDWHVVVGGGVSTEVDVAVAGEGRGGEGAIVLCFETIHVTALALGERDLRFDSRAWSVPGCLARPLLSPAPASWERRRGPRSTSPCCSCYSKGLFTIFCFKCPRRMPLQLWNNYLDQTIHQYLFRGCHLPTCISANPLKERPILQKRRK